MSGADTPQTTDLSPALAGRDHAIHSYNTMLGRAAAGRSSQYLVVSGVRGAGKTSLLKHFSDTTEQSGWIPVSIDGGFWHPASFGSRTWLSA